jgi:hypothetical protein
MYAKGTFANNVDYTNATGPNAARMWHSGQIAKHNEFNQAWYLHEAPRWSTREQITKSFSEHAAKAELGPFGGVAGYGHKKQEHENGGWTCPTVNETCNPSKGEGDVKANDYSQGGKCEEHASPAILKDKSAGTNMVNWCPEVSDEELMSSKCCKETRDGNLRDKATDEYFPQKSKRCCHQECNSLQNDAQADCIKGCNLWIAHSSLNWQADWRPKLKAKCKFNCRAITKLMAQPSDLSKPGHYQHLIEKLQLAGGVSDCQTGCQNFEQCSDNGGESPTGGTRT